jgi:uncharacterized protein YndB with AHSA1/START domain
MKTIKQTYHINAPIEKVWEALINPEHINGWGGGPAKMTNKKGEKFSLWGGQIHGTNTDVVAPNTLVQQWYGGKWLQASTATFSLEEEKNGTKVTLLHTDVPDEEAEDIESGWKEYYLGPLKKYVEKKK